MYCREARIVEKILRSNSKLITATYHSPSFSNGGVFSSFPPVSDGVFAIYRTHISVKYIETVTIVVCNLIDKTWTYHFNPLLFM